MLTGLGSVGTGVLGAGLFTYLFLSLAGRVLGPEEFAPVSALWAMVFIVGPGLFLPVQQELGRAIGGQRGAGGGRHALTKVALLAGGFALVTIVIALLVREWITRELLGGSDALLWCFLGSVLAYAVTFVARGVASGLGDYKEFGQLVAAESAARLAIAAALTPFTGDSQAVFGIAIVLAPFVSVVIVTRMGRKLRLEPGVHQGWRDVTWAMGWLLLGSMMAQFLANAGPLAVQLLATSSQENQAGRFLSALVIARLAIYLFQALQATLLPNLAELVARGQVAELQRGMRRLVVFGAVLTLVSTIGAYLLGAVAVRLLFGTGFSVSAESMALLSGASAIYVLAAALSGVAIAASGHRLSSLAWLAGSLAFVGGTMLLDDLFRRVELGYLLGSCTAAAVLMVALPVHLRRRRVDAAVGA